MEITLTLIKIKQPFKVFCTILYADHTYDPPDVQTSSGYILLSSPATVIKGKPCELTDVEISSYGIFHLAESNHCTDVT